MILTILAKNYKVDVWQGTKGAYTITVTLAHLTTDHKVHIIYNQ